MDVANDLKRLIRAKHKRAFTFVMGKLNVAKMANFAEVDVFVLVASPENSLLDSKGCHRRATGFFSCQQSLFFDEC